MTHRILPGSLEIHPDHATAGVHKGAHDFDLTGGLRYIEVQLEHSQVTVAELMRKLAETYEGSTGCVVKGDFKMTVSKS